MTQPCAQDLRETVVRAAASLRAMTAERARARLAAGKWSAQEIIGHLIDSASNNHQRFVRARFRDDLEFDGYDQVEWVQAQDYQSAAWTEVPATLRGFMRDYVAHLEHHTRQIDISLAAEPGRQRREGAIQS